MSFARQPALGPAPRPALAPGEAAAAAALVAGVRARNANAVAALFDRFGPHVHNILLHVLGPEPDVGDLLHDVFVKAIERSNELRDPGALKAWLSSIAVLTARSHLRRRRRFWTWPSKVPERFEPAPHPPPHISTALRLTFALLDRIPTDERIPFALRTIEGMKIAEIAEVCQTSAATIKRRLQRADKRFRRLAQRHSVLHEWLEHGEVGRGR